MSKIIKEVKLDNNTDSDLSNIDSDEYDSDSSFEEIFEINGLLDSNEIVLEKKYNTIKKKDKKPEIKIKKIFNKKKKNPKVTKNLILKKIIIKKK